MIVTESYDDPDVQLLMTMPGVDYTIAHALKATLADVGRFPEPDKAASYLGLVPSVKQSAGKCYTGPITKAGASQVRWLLIQAAQCVSRHPGPLGAFFRKLAKTEEPQRGGGGHRSEDGDDRRGTCSRTKSRTAMHVPRCTDEKLAALRVHATGEKRKGGRPKGSKRVSKLGGGQSRTIPSLDEVYARQGLPSQTAAHRRRKADDSRERNRAIRRVAGQAEGRAQEVIVLSAAIRGCDNEATLSSGSTGGFPSRLRHRLAPVG